jgi:hypothetical protein
MVNVLSNFNIIMCRAFIHDQDYMSPLLNFDIDSLVDENDVTTPLTI